MVNNYDYYQMQARHYYSLLLRLMDQFDQYLRKKRNAHVCFEQCQQ